VQILFVYSNVRRTIQYHEREVGQVDLVDLVEDLLSGVRVSRGQLLLEQIV